MTPPVSIDMNERQRRAERGVVDAALAWKRVYWAWLDAEPATPRDLCANGENMALSYLLDALQELAVVEQEHA